MKEFSSRDHGRSSLGVVPPVVGESLGSSVIAAETVDSGFNENEPVLGIFILPALFHVAADVHGLLDQAVDVFRNFRGATCISEKVPFFLRSLTIF